MPDPVTQSSTLQDAYFDRNQAAMALAAACMSYGFPAGLKESDDPEWPILFVELPQGQVSWHLPRVEIVEEWPTFEGEWDGHTLEQKRQRLSAFIGYLLERI